LAFGIGSRSSGQITRFGLQPLADDGGALLAILTAYLQQIVTEGTLISRKFTRPGVTDARRFRPWFVGEQPTCFGRARPQRTGARVRGHLSQQLQREIDRHG